MLCRNNGKGYCNLSSAAMWSFTAALRKQNSTLKEAVILPTGSAGVTVEAASADFYAGGGDALPQPPAAPHAAEAAGQAGGALALQLRFQLPTSVYATMAVGDLIGGRALSKIRRNVLAR